MRTASRVSEIKIDQESFEGFQKGFQKDGDEGFFKKISREMKVYPKNALQGIF